MTPYMRSEKFRTASVENDSTHVYKHCRWTVDEAADLEFIRAYTRLFAKRRVLGCKIFCN